MDIMLRFYSNVSAIRRRHLQTLQMGGEVEYHEEQPRPGDGLSCWPLLGDDAFARSNWPQLHSWTWIAAAGSKEAVIPSCCDRLVRRMFCQVLQERQLSLRRISRLGLLLVNLS